MWKAEQYFEHHIAAGENQNGAEGVACSADLLWGSAGLALQSRIQGWLHMWLPEHDFFSTLSHCCSFNCFADSPFLTRPWNARVLQSSIFTLFTSCITSVLEWSFSTLEVPTVFPNIYQTSVPGCPLGSSNPTPPEFSMSSSPPLKCLPFQTPVDKRCHLFIVYETGNVFTSFASHFQLTPRSCQCCLRRPLPPHFW